MTLISALLIPILYYVSLTIKSKNRYKIIYILFVLELSLNAFCSVNNRSLIPVSRIDSMNYFDETLDIVDYLDKTDSGFYRVSKKYAYDELNDHMIQHYYGEKYYCSTLAAAYWNIQNMFDLRGKNSNYFKSFDEKQFLRDITCSKYMISEAERNVYGYKLIRNEGDKYLYVNKNAMNFGILYDHYISNENYEKLPGYKKGDILYQACVVENTEKMKGLSELNDTDLFEISEIEYSIDFSNSYIELTLDKPNANPVLLEITTSNFPGWINGYIYNTISETQADWDDYINIELTGNATKYYYIDALDMKKLLINILPENISEIHLYEKNMIPIEKQIEVMKESIFQIEEFSDSYVQGKIKVGNGSRLLFVPIIYDKNWHVYIDNVEQETLIANGGFLAVMVPGGESELVFQYEAKSYRYGMVLTICSIVIVAIILIKKQHSIVRKRNQVKG